MYGSRIVLAGLLMALACPVATAEGHPAGRMALLAEEAAALSREAELATGQAPQPLPGITTGDPAPEAGAALAASPGTGRFSTIAPTLPPGPVGGVALGALALAALAAYLATHARVRRRSGAGAGEVREVTWRFRSPHPLRIGGDSAHRVAAVLDEIEQLGQQLRAITTTPGGGRSAGPKPEATLPVRPAAPAPPPAPETVVFVRRPEETVKPEPDDGPAIGPESGTSRLQIREAVYARARRMLRAGEDRLAVREATGLKFAEIDLLRCARAGERAA